MKFQLIILYLLFVSSFGLAQSEESGNKLVGTTVLTASEKNMESRWLHGLFLEKLLKSECLSSGSEKTVPTKINFVEIKNDSTMVVDITVNANCCADFLGEIEVTKDNVLNLISHSYGGFCSCGCCFGLTYQIFLAREEDYDFSKIKSVMINGIKETETPIGWVKK
nr:hypothetical protein [uncultured Flavobacterium sp.]